MEIYQGLVLGALQGLTEFLPVSSSGHLVLGQKLFGIEEPSLSFNIALHFGTLLAIFIIFFKDIKMMFSSFFRFLTVLNNKEKRSDLWQNDIGIKLILLVLIGSVPTAVIGLLIKKYGMFLFSSTVSVGIMLIITGSLLWFSKKFSNTNIDIERFSHKKALLIGIIQGLAVIPGISRSGSTVASGLFLGIERQLAARFSFLLSIPAILGATLLELKDVFKEEALSFDLATVFGTIVAFLVGLIALKWLIQIVNKGKFYLFAPYCWFLGLIALLVG